MRRPQPSYKKVKSLRAENAKPKKQTARTVELKPEGNELHEKTKNGPAARVAQKPNRRVGQQAGRCNRRLVYALLR
jgi:hypothetical protein